jgi:hypothetical protein
MDTSSVVKSGADALGRRREPDGEYDAQDCEKKANAVEEKIFGIHVSSMQSRRTVWLTLFPSPASRRAAVSQAIQKASPPALVAARVPQAAPISRPPA